MSRLPSAVSTIAICPSCRWNCSSWLITGIYPSSIWIDPCISAMGSASSVLSTVVDTDNCCTHPCKVVVDGWKVVGIEVVNDIETRGDGWRVVWWWVGGRNYRSYRHLNRVDITVPLFDTTTNADTISKFGWKRSGQRRERRLMAALSSWESDDMMNSYNLICYLRSLLRMIF